MANPRQLTIPQALELATRHHHAGELAQAERIYRQILAASPEHAPTLHQLGVLYFQAGQPQQAAQLLSRAVQLNPASAMFHCNLGRVLAQLDQIDAAIAALLRAVELQPDYPEAWNNLGNALMLVPQYANAIEAFERSISLRPGSVPTLLNLASAQRGNRQYDQAIATARQALGSRPDDPAVLNALGNIFEDAGEHDEAIRLLERAIQLAPQNAEAHVNLATSLASLSRYEESMQAARRAIAIDPNMALAHCNLGLTLLLLGRFTEGWAENEWRTHLLAGRLYRQRFPQPQWDGSELSGKSILICAEQGFGDTIQFIRYVPLVAGRGGKMIVVCPDQLHRIIRDVPGVASIHRPGDAVPHIDVQIQMMGLPRVFWKEEGSIPPGQAYLRPVAEDVEKWRSRLQSYPHKLKVGLVWSGSAGRRYRSMQLSNLAPLAQHRDIAWFSLQKGPAATEIASPGQRLEVIDYTDELHDFADTAALIENLDLVITVDTAVAHLAGALGKPAWVILPVAPDWRWMLERTDSIWYPSVRLFRQPVRGDWETPIAQIISALRGYEPTDSLRG